MSRYYFHIGDRGSHPDAQGIELAGLAEARVQALKLTSALLKQLGEKFWTGREWVMRVTDERDLTLFTLMFTASNAPAVQA